MSSFLRPKYRESGIPSKQPQHYFQSSQCCFVFGSVGNNGLHLDIFNSCTHSISLVPVLANTNLPEVFLAHNIAIIVMMATIMLARPKDSAIVSLIETKYCQRRRSESVGWEGTERILMYLWDLPDMDIRLRLHWSVGFCWICSGEIPIIYTKLEMGSGRGGIVDKWLYSFYFWGNDVTFRGSSAMTSCPGNTDA